jgi:hypothetical protein
MLIQFPAKRHEELGMQSTLPVLLPTPISSDPAHYNRADLAIVEARLGVARALYGPTYRNHPAYKFQLHLSRTIREALYPVVDRREDVRMEALLHPAPPADPRLKALEVLAHSELIARLQALDPTYSTKTLRHFRHEKLARMLLATMAPELPAKKPVLSVSHCRPLERQA